MSKGSDLSSTLLVTKQGRDFKYFFRIFFIWAFEFLKTIIEDSLKGVLNFKFDFDHTIWNGINEWGKNIQGENPCLCILL